MLRAVNRAVARPSIALVLALVAQASLAQSLYTLAPRVGVTLRGDNNLLLGSRDKIVTGGADSAVSFDLNRQSSGWKSDLVPRVNLRRFVVDSGFDADEYGVNLYNDYTGEYLTAALDVGYSHDSTLITEATDTGLTRDVIARDGIDVSPSITWLMNERWQTQFSFNFNDTSYASTASGLLDYRYLLGSSQVSYTYDDTTQLFTTFFVSDFDVPFTTFFVSDFDVPSIGNHTRTYGLQAGMTKVLTPTIRVTGSAGYVISDIDKNITARSTGPIANFTLQKQLALSSFAKFEYSRQLSPGGRGTQTISDRMALRADLKLKQDWLLILMGSHDMRTSQGGLFASDSDRDYTELRGALRYEISREWSTTGAYRFAFRQNTGLSTDSASGHAVTLSIEYNGLPRAIPSLNGL